ncbi:MAG: sulfite exporter TauE/SafE family protein [Chitinivorax sp.]
MNIGEILLLGAAGLLAGALNAVAGGGSFITFPALVHSGLNSILANTTSSVALWPASIASVVAYRQELASQRPLLLRLGAASIAGSLLGAGLLLWISPRTFDHLVPWLLLLATLLFAFSGRITQALQQRPDRPPPSLASFTLGQFAVAIYGGFFGGGMGIMMLAMMSLYSRDSLHRMNLKTAVGAYEFGRSGQIGASCILGIAMGEANANGQRRRSSSCSAVQTMSSVCSSLGSGKRCRWGNWRTSSKGVPDAFRAMVALD